MLPNFIIAGATASGTSFLTHLLMQHDDIYLPKDIESEPHFFSLSHRYARGIQSYQETWFSDWNKQKAIGERSSTYLHFDKTAERLKKYLPNIKLIFVLRDPVDRAWAHYRYMVLRGLEELDFRDALDLEKSRRDKELTNPAEKRHHDYTERSLYGEQLEQYLHFFSFDQILILSSENLRQHTRFQLNRVTNFLEVAPLDNFTYISEFTSVSVKDPSIQAKILQHLGSKKTKAIVEAIRYKQKDLNIYIESETDKKFIAELINNLHESKEPLPPDIQTSLQERFKPDQTKFFDLTSGHIDFNSW